MFESSAHTAPLSLNWVGSFIAFSTSFEVMYQIKIKSQSLFITVNA